MSLHLPLAALAAVLPLAGGAASLPRVEFNRDIRPILSENCFYCHGQDPKHREAKLRLDLRDEALRDLGGYAAIVPGDPAHSELLSRLRTHDPEDVMPPLKTHKQITPAQMALLESWISQGAVYQKHWAFVAPQPFAEPAVANPGWCRNEVDHFVLARLEQEGLSPAAEAAPESWLRRAALDLTGLPPTLADMETFRLAAAARGEAAYAEAADRLLASQHFGERLALDWLDAARYADTHGFNNDSQREMWRWRDWVIEAFNANLPYDRFITEQLAGDLLPQPTLEQRIATGFSRNHVINSEGGIIDEEYRVEYVADRVRTMSTAWLGLTLECARCHDHKFDPVTSQDYYRMFAFFNNVAEHGEDGRVANAVPMIPAPTREQQAEDAQQGRSLAALAARLERAPPWRPEDRAAMGELVAKILRVPGSVALLQDTAVENGRVGEAASRLTGGEAPTIKAEKLDLASKGGSSFSFWLKPAADNPRDVPLFSGLNYHGSPADAAYGRGRELRLIDGELEWRVSERFPVYAVVVRTQGAAVRPEEWHHVSLIQAGGRRAADIRFFVDGREAPVRVQYDGLSAQPANQSLLVGADNAAGGAHFFGELDKVRGFSKSLSQGEAKAQFQGEALPLALDDYDKGAASAREQAWLREARTAGDPETAALSQEYSEEREKHLALLRSFPTAMVMEEGEETRPTRLLTRGRYDLPAEEVQAGVPEALLASWPAGAPRNRLGLAQWLTQPQQPLTGRVVVNRFWAQLFGTGLVKTMEDFGAQGEWPSHPELLDTLAREFVDGGWNVKALLRTLVLSSTYRQASTVTADLVARDPENRLLARGPRVRLPAEIIRDQALAISGLLAPKLGGPSVYPYQPDKLYEGVVVGADYPGTHWLQSSGEGLYRRSLYTFWKRTVPHPAMLTFDAPDREVCTVRRSRTNTPLQALLLWNETGYLEAARQLASRMFHEGGPDDKTQVTFAFQLATGRRPGEREIAVLTSTLRRMRDDFRTHPDDAIAFLKIGESPADPALPPADLAAATSVASMILNLDETITNH